MKHTFPKLDWRQMSAWGQYNCFWWNRIVLRLRTSGQLRRFGTEFWLNFVNESVCWSLVSDKSTKLLVMPCWLMAPECLENTTFIILVDISTMPLVRKQISCTSPESMASTMTSWHGNTWWRHQMETFSALLAICAGNSPVPGEFPTQRPVTRSFDVFFDLRLNKRLSKQSWGWWFETPSRPLWRHRNDFPRNWPVAMGIHQSPVDHQNKGPATWSYMFLDVCLKELLNKKSSCQRCRHSNYLSMRWLNLWFDWTIEVGK